MHRKSSAGDQIKTHKVFHKHQHTFQEHYYISHRGDRIFHTTAITGIPETWRFWTINSRVTGYSTNVTVIFLITFTNPKTRTKPRWNSDHYHAPLHTSISFLDEQRFVNYHFTSNKKIQRRSSKIIKITGKHWSATFWRIIDYDKLESKIDRSFKPPWAKFSHNDPEVVPTEEIAQIFKPCLSGFETLALR